MAKAILKDVSKETSRSQEMGFAWLNDDGTIHPVDSLARVEMVLEYLAYANSSHGDLELEGPGKKREMADPESVDGDGQGMPRGNWSAP